MRLAMTEHFGIAEQEKRVVRFLDTDNAELCVANLELIGQLVSRSCPACEVEHVVWLPPGAIVIEQRPFLYWCNDNFAVAARAAGAKYFDVINTGRLDILRGEIECQSTRNYSSRCSTRHG
jgi:hypothetical protein